MAYTCSITYHCKIWQNPNFHCKREFSESLQTYKIPQFMSHLVHQILQNISIILPVPHLAKYFAYIIVASKILNNICLYYINLDFIRTSISLLYSKYFFLAQIAKTFNRWKIDLQSIIKLSFFKTKSTQTCEETSFDYHFFLVFSFYSASL